LGFKGIGFRVSGLGCRILGLQAYGLTYLRVEGFNIFDGLKV
jgi:hypothetical protein